MLICPNCHCEYEEGYKICSDCQCELIEKPKIIEDSIIKPYPEHRKLIISVIVILCLFLGGIIIAFLGFTKGMEMASNLSRPDRNAIGWTIPNEMIIACTYIPVIIGIALILLSLSLCTVLFIKWIYKDS